MLDKLNAKTQSRAHGALTLWQIVLLKRPESFRTGEYLGIMLQFKHLIMQQYS